jgi:hypothetical protein
MKSVKFHIAATTTENLFVTILCWYLVGSVTILVILTIVEWLLQIL